MKIGLRIFLGYFLIVGLAGFFVMRVFVDEVKPGVRQAMEDTLVDTATLLSELAANDMRSGQMATGEFSRSVDRLQRRDVEARIWSFRKKSFDYRIYVTDARGIVVYDSSGRDIGKDYSRWNDVYLTLRGKYGARSTLADPADPNSSVMHVAAPMHDGDKLIGVLAVAKSNQRIQPFIASSQDAILKQGWVLLGLSFLIGIGVTLWLSNSLARLGRFAKAVAAGEKVAAPDLGNSEIGELGRALDTMRLKLDGKQYVEQYVQTLAHEMKGPLAAIRGAAEILEDAPPGPERERFLANIEGQSLRLSGMIDKMLALAAVEYRQSLQDTENLDLRAVASEALDAAMAHAARKNITLALDAGTEAATINGDRFLLAQAMANLLDNALDFSPAGSTVRVAITQEDGQWQFAVTDEGPGIPDYAQARIFERFYSLARPGGTRSSGLGLSFVREVALLHRGRVSLENRIDGGAVATLELPAAIPGRG